LVLLIYFYFIMCSCFFHHLLVVHFLFFLLGAYASFNIFLLCAPIVFRRLFAIYVFFAPSCCELMLLICASFLRTFGVHQHLLAMYSYCSSMLLYYVLLLFINLLCCAFLLFVSTSLLCDLVVHQHLLAMCSWCSPMPPHCVVHSCCLFVPPYYVFLMFVNIFLLCYYYSWALFFIVFSCCLLTPPCCVFQSKY
jgi:hypothetical protein